MCNLSFHQDPQLSGMEPHVGPMSGGTEISIKGTKLNTGANIEVWLGPKGQNPCNVNRYVKLIKHTVNHKLLLSANTRLHVCDVIMSRRHVLRTR